MRILCLGAGAAGDYFCARLIEAGADVTFLVREQRRKRLAENGLRLESVYGNFAGPVKAIVKSELSGPYDVILLTCKAYDLPEAIKAIAPALGALDPRPKQGAACAHTGAFRRAHRTLNYRMQFNGALKDFDCSG